MAIPASAKAMAFIVTRDRGKAKRFYGDTLGFALMQEDDFAAVFDLNGTKLRISEVADHAPQSHTVLGWEVADISETAKALRGKGIAFNRMMAWRRMNSASGRRLAEQPKSLGSAIPTAMY